VPLPAGPAGDYALIGQAAIGVFAASPNAPVAAEFLAYMTNPENSAKLSQFFPSARQSLLTAEALGKTNPLLSPEQLEAVVINGITNLPRSSRPSAPASTASGLPMPTSLP
jgi:multiple sugar transport system substrate-binding protein